jgi:hypothetical protein
MICKLSRQNRVYVLLFGLLLLVQMSGCGRKTPLKPRRVEMPRHPGAVLMVYAG